MLGIRPEAVRVSRQPEAGATAMQVHLIEPLGAYDIVDLRLGEDNLRARTPSGFIAQTGGQVFVRLDSQQTHFFSRLNGLSLAASPG